MKNKKLFRCRRIVIAVFFILIAIRINVYNKAVAEEKSKYYLVGTGSGDPDLITLRAINVIKEADLIICSKKTHEKFASYLEGKEIYYGSWRLWRYYGEDCAKLKGKKRKECKEISRERKKYITKVRKATKQNKTIAVLDSGDPLIYGPCSWSLEEFEDLNLVVIPGISCFNAANAALRKDFHLSEHTKSVILTARDWPGKTDTILDLSTHQAAMVIFTMGGKFNEFIKKLSVNYTPETPVAIVEYAGYAEKERVISGTLDTILDKIKDKELPFEYLLYVGDFLTYHKKKMVK